MKKNKFTFSKFLLVSKSNMRGVVDLGPDAGVLIEFVLATDSEGGLILGGGPAQVDAGLQLGVKLLVNRPTEYLKTKKNVLVRTKTNTTITVTRKLLSPEMLKTPNSINFNT